MKQRLLVVGVLVSVFALLGASCSESEPTSQEPGQPIVIGRVVARTGWMEFYDGPTQAGVDLAIQDINESGGVLGRQLRVVEVDYKTDLDLVRSSALEVLDEGAQFLLVATDFNFAEPAARAAGDQQVVSFSAAGSPQFGLQGVGPYAFNINSGTVNEGGTMAEWAYSQGYRHAYNLVDTTIDYGKTCGAAFEQRWTDIAGEAGLAGSDTFLNDDTSFAAQITRIGAAEDADFIGICSYVPGAATLLRQLRASGVDLPVVGSLGFEGTYWLDAVPDLSDLYYVTYGSVVGDDPNPKVNELVSRAEEALGQPPATATHVLLGYSAMQALARAIEVAGSTDGDEVRQALEQFNDEPLVAYPVSYTGECHVPQRRPMTIMQVQNGVASFVERFQAEDLPPAPC